MLTSSEHVQIADLFNKMSATDYDIVAGYFRDAHRKLQSKVASTFGRGDRVKFMSPSGKMVTGVIAKINRKSIRLRDEAGTQWLVSPSLLQYA